MRRAFRLAALMLLLVPTRAWAMQLHWSSGADTLSFTEATRAMLVLSADPNEAALPPEWRLLWVGDSTEVVVVASDSLEACGVDTAKAYAVEGPSSAADSSAHLVTARFCSGGASASDRATFVLDLPAWARGKCKVVALDPADSTSVLESNEVTFNGGVDAPYAAIVLGATSSHESLQLRVTVIGVGLTTTRAVSLNAPDDSWDLPLTVTAWSDSEVTAVASVAAVLPACDVSVESQTGSTSIASLPAEEEPPLEGPLGCQAQYFENLLQPPPRLGYAIQPKDFAFVKGFVGGASHRFALHLFYIRRSYYSIPADSNEKNIGHIWTTDFNSWYGPGGLNKPDTVALAVRSNKFDQLHVWAPTIVRPHGSPVFRMFYTGVRNESGKRHQRIGVATSTDLITWTPADTVVLSCPKVPWAKKDPATVPGDPYGGAQQLRDPFVMEDPTNPGQWLMFFVAEDSLNAPKMAVGVARSADLATWDVLPDPYLSTEEATFQGPTTLVESPHVFLRNGQWWLLYTVGLDQVFFETSAQADPTVTDPAAWTAPTWLRGVTEGEPPELQYWHASEHLRINSTQYLAAFDDNATSIDIKGMFTPANAAVDSLRLDCPQIAGVGDAEAAPDGVRMSTSVLRSGAPEVRLRLELPSRLAVRLAVYDIAGRRRATLLDGELPAGVTETVWDGRDRLGSRVASGVYFIRLACSAGTRRSKIVMLR